MKTLNCGANVLSRQYYYLLDWNEQDKWSYITTHFNKSKLHLLNYSEFKQLWEHAVQIDTIEMHK